MVSESRARFCQNYLAQNYHITADRFTYESYGSEKEPENVTTDWGSYRCTELIITGE